MHIEANGKILRLCAMKGLQGFKRCAEPHLGRAEKLRGEKIS
jgi:hypothetical protein